MTDTTTVTVIETGESCFKMDTIDRDKGGGYNCRVRMCRRDYGTTFYDTIIYVPFNKSFRWALINSIGDATNVCIKDMADNVLLDVPPATG